MLASDYGKDDSNPFDQAIDFTELKLGLDRCKARNQLFIIDCCREVSPELLLNRFVGHAIIPGHRSYSVPARNEKTIYSTGPGTSSFGRVNQTTIFTDALLESLNGIGADDSRSENNEWIVDTDSLHRGIKVLLENSNDLTDGQTQVGSGYDVGLIELHYIPKRIIPKALVKLETNPRCYNPCVTFSYSNDDIEPSILDIGSEPRLIRLKQGIYKFSALLREKKIKNGSCEGMIIRPPFKRVVIGLE